MLPCRFLPAVEPLVRQVVQVDTSPTTVGGQAARHRFKTLQAWCVPASSKAIRKPVAAVNRKSALHPAAASAQLPDNNCVPHVGQTAASNVDFLPNRQPNAGYRSPLSGADKENQYSRGTQVKEFTHDSIQEDDENHLPGFDVDVQQPSKAGMGVSVGMLPVKLMQQGKAAEGLGGQQLSKPGTSKALLQRSTRKTAIHMR